MPQSTRPYSEQHANGAHQAQSIALLVEGFKAANPSLSAKVYADALSRPGAIEELRAPWGRYEQLLFKTPERKLYWDQMKRRKAARLGLPDPLPAPAVDCEVDDPEPEKPVASRGWVYFIQRVSDGAIKIGFSSNAKRRLKNLQTATPDELMLLITISGDCAEEGRWHERFRHLNIRGEWFRPEPDLLAAIQALSSPITLKDR